MRHETNVLDEEYSQKKESFLSLNLIVKSGKLLEAALGEKPRESEITLIEGSLLVSF